MGVGGQSDTNPVFSWQQVEDACKGGKKFIVIDGNVCDVSNWVDRHPGGKVESCNQFCFLKCNNTLIGNVTVGAAVLCRRGCHGCSTGIS